MHPIKVETEKGHEIVTRLILSQIEQGQIVPGQKLPSVVDLSISFGVGRSTIREALSALKAMGWVDVRHGGGTFVKKILPSDVQPGAGDPFLGAESVREILEVRKVLEVGTVALAADRRNKDDLNKLQTILTRMELAMINNDTYDGERADVEFHSAIAAASHNSLLIQLMDSLTQRLTETIGKTRELWFYEDKSSASRLLEEHKNIYEAIAHGDKSRAVELIEAHLTKVENVLNKRGGTSTTELERHGFYKK
ncbi:HTH-type transcriptional regulator LutR [Paenibacillus baekrokdamisoli]|uniref:HTH-type transcriptional regulator LutR n=1 Tax=Paenibacillus baekrokdamisoli TaxID=1712516 RepID=A0A3G9J0M7_9BACL|nr:FadR/GntR family transcriptional regulator [Paenibacillus baekrokdamisoli]MBB3072164.1 GntR family transcriptional repressor for pyruvate dehydrogenase complex [Paenibacillus baekrokdamisoli]BBH24747.1 HTH-type transcriptional regulator LutR [Paenibacillus baekrokdamisoli]